MGLIDTRRKRNKTMIVITAELNISFAFFVAITNMKRIHLKLPNVILKLVTGLKNKVNADRNGNQNVIFHQLKRVATGTVLLCSLILRHQEKLNYLNFMMLLV